MPYPRDPALTPLSLPAVADPLTDVPETTDFRAAPPDLSARTVGLPLLSDRGSLPGQMPAILIGGLLVADRFVDASLNEQTFFLLAMLALGQGIPIDRAVNVYTSAGDPATEVGARPITLDLATGTTWCRPEDALRDELAATALHRAPSEPVAPDHWAYQLAEPLAGLVSLYVSRVRAYRTTIDAPLLWVMTSAGIPRPVDITDAMRWLAHWGPALTHPATIGDFSRLCETITWLPGTHVSPAILPLLTGTAIERQAVSSAYHAPLSSTRQRMGARIWDVAVAEIQQRLLGVNPAAAARFAGWLAEGAAHAPSSRPSVESGIRVGTPRCQTLASVATAYVASMRSYHTAIQDMTAPETGHVLERHAALTMRVLGGYRIEDLARLDMGLIAEILRLRQLSRDNQATLTSVTIKMKPKGDSVLRPTHVIMPRPCQEALTTYLEWAMTTGRGGPLFSAVVLAELRRILPGARHTLSTTLLDHYDELGWTPSDYRLWQGMFGHQLAGFPLGADGDCTIAQARRVIDAATELYLRQLLRAASAQGRDVQHEA